MTEFTPEMIQKAKAAKSFEELKALAKENELELTDEEAQAYYEQLHATTGEMEDDELENVAGGGCHKKDGRLIITAFSTCRKWACERCGGNEKNFWDEHGCGPKKNGGYTYTRRFVCTCCKYMSYEKGLWLCNHPENRE